MIKVKSATYCFFLPQPDATVLRSPTILCSTMRIRLEKADASGGGDSRILTANRELGAFCKNCQAARKTRLAGMVEQV